MPLAPDVPFEIGQAAFGGYVVGVIDTTRPGSIIATDASQTGQRYVLIMAPKTLQSAAKWSGGASPVNGPSASRTRWDGLTATSAMAGASAGLYPAGQYCWNLAYPTGDGGSRWYLPAMDEFELMYRNLKPTTEANWSSARAVTGFPDAGGTSFPGENISSDPSGVGYTAGSPAQTALVNFQTGGAEALHSTTGTTINHWTSTDQDADNGQAWYQAVSGTTAGGQSPVSMTTNLWVRPVRRVLVSDLNHPPVAPTLTTPADASVLDRATAQRFAWVFSDPDTSNGDSQSAYSVRYRRAGTADAWTDTGWVASPSSWHDFPAGTFAAGDYEWQAATKDAQGVAGPFSGSAFFTAGDAPPAPSITGPPNGGTVGTDPATLTWSTPDQDAYQVQVLDGATVVHDTGTVTTTAARSVSLPFPDNNTTRTLRVRVLDGGLWSPWAAVTVTVAYTTPAVPALTLTPDDTTGTITVAVTHPAPVGDQPPVISHDVWVREVGETGDGIRVAAAITGDYTWQFPASGIDYEARVRAYADTGTSSWSAWTA
ncbi:MAG TPA: hypothetical protein VIO38_08975 [Rariglobus sp.]